MFFMSSDMVGCEGGQALGLRVHVRETETETERKREKERQIERDTEREPERQIDRERAYPIDRPLLLIALSAFPSHLSWQH